MMHVLPRWKVTVTFADRSVVFWIHDNFLSNVLRKVADLQFSETGLDSELGIGICQSPRTNEATVVSTGQVDGRGKAIDG